jgi:diaminopimelate epimerase
MIGFHKLHGLGNCFIFFEEWHQDLRFLKNPELIKLICDTSKGLGSDGVVFISPPKDPKHNCRMQMFNIDGTEAEMCGNAIRCVAHLYSQLFLGVDNIQIETAVGVKSVKYVKTSCGEIFYQAEMGKALLDLVATGELAPESKRKPLVWKEQTLNPVYVNVGNPHAVLFMETLPAADEMKSIGAWLEYHANHPRRINIEFVKVLAKNKAQIHIWERGCGMTQACGTGATAVAMAGIEKGILSGPIEINMPGGALTIAKDTNDNLLMTGPVQEVMTGTLATSFLNSISRD